MKGGKINSQVPLPSWEMVRLKMPWSRLFDKVDFRELQAFHGLQKAVALLLVSDRFALGAVVGFFAFDMFPSCISVRYESWKDIAKLLRGCPEACQTVGLKGQLLPPRDAGGVSHRFRLRFPY